MRLYVSYPFRSQPLNEPSSPLYHHLTAIRGAAVDKPALRALIEHLAKSGKVLTEHIGYDVPEAEPITDEEIYERDVAWLRESDLVVAECSAPSLGVGYELGYAEAIGKTKVLCLYREQDKQLSGMIAGNPKAFECHTYTTLEEAKEIIDTWMAKVL